MTKNNTFTFEKFYDKAFKLFFTNCQGNHDYEQCQCGSFHKRYRNVKSSIYKVNCLQIHTKEKELSLCK